MSTSHTGGKAWVAGLATAAAASLCCITPVLALVSGTGSIASVFSWMEPYRPYLIGLTVAILGLAWYLKLRPKKARVACDCEEGRASFFQSKIFLGIITGLAILLMTFPAYSKIFYPQQKAREMMIADKGDIRQIKLNITGMDCEACSHFINQAISKVPGVLEYNTIFKDRSSVVKFDHSKTNEQAIINAVNTTGFKVSGTTYVH